MDGVTVEIVDGGIIVRSSAETITPEQQAVINDAVEHAVDKLIRRLREDGA